MLSGVPQGTVLGPLLFLAYINDLVLPDSLRSSEARLFADDSLLYLTVNGAKGNNLLQEDLSALEDWERAWQMSFNPSKCTIIRITSGKKRKKSAFQSSYTLHSQVLEVTDASKYLGVKVTDDLTWSKHISEVAGKANRTLGFLRRNFKQCTKEVKTATYIPQWSDQCSTTHPLYGIRITKETSRSSNKYNDEPPDMCIMIIPPVHLVVSQQW